MSRLRPVLSVTADVASIVSALAVVGAVLTFTHAVSQGQLVPALTGKGAGPGGPPRSPLAATTGRMPLKSGTEYVPSSATVALIEFADFECPYCSKFDRDVWPQLKREFVDAGQVAFVYRDFPLKKHKQALLASLAASCAGSQGKYWEMHSRLFSQPTNLSRDALVENAKSLNLKPLAFEACLGSEPNQKIQQDSELGLLFNVTVTPTFFVGVVQADGQVDLKAKMLGAQPIEAFRRELNQVLSEPGSRK